MPGPQSQPTSYAQMTMASNLLQRAMADLEAAWKGGAGVSVEQYYEQHRDLGPVQTAPVVLVYHEYCLRHKYGDAPPLETYQARFPHLYPMLRTMAQEPGDNTPRPSPAEVPSERVPVSNAPQPVPGPAANVVMSKFAGDYRLIELLGSGSFADVWRGEAPGGIAVAIKVVRQALDAEEAQRELQALELTKNLRLPTLLQTHSVWVQDNRLHIVMELAEMSLRKRLKICKQQGDMAIPTPELLGYLREAAEALDFLRKHRIYHRDVKPDNILLIEGHAKVADFGLARLGSGQSMRLLEASYAGTPLYMAPEVFRNRVSPNSDQYSLASTYVELRSGEQLFQSGNLHELILKHLEEKPDLSRLPNPEADVLHRALAKEPSERFGSCSEFVAALEDSMSARQRRSRRSAKATARILQSLHEGSSAPDDATDPHAPAVASLQRPPAPPRRRAWTAGIAGTLGLAILAGGIAFWLSRDGRPGADGTPATLAETTKPSSPIPAAVYLPPGWRKADDAQESPYPFGDKKVYDHVSVEKAGSRISLRYVPQLDSSVSPFYVMETKVSNELFGKFANQNPEAVKDGKWEDGWSDRKDKYPGGKLRGDWPVVNISCREAFAFANWLGGRVPTVRQWDRAAGCYPGQHGPILAPIDDEPARDESGVAYGRDEQGPLPVGVAKRDVSPWQCRDMAGNGREWTRTSNDATLGNIEAPPPASQKVRMVSRGRSFRAPDPVRFIDEFTYIERESDVNPPFPFDERRYDLGFRVVFDKLP